MFMITFQFANIIQFQAAFILRHISAIVLLAYACIKKIQLVKIIPFQLAFFASRLCRILEKKKKKEKEKEKKEEGIRRQVALL